MQHEKTIQTMPALQACRCCCVGRLLRSVLANGCEEGEQILRKRKQREQIKPTMTSEQMQEFISAGLEASKSYKQRCDDVLLPRAKVSGGDVRIDSNAPQSISTNKGLLEFIEKASKVESDFAQRGKIHGI